MKHPAAKARTVAKPAHHVKPAAAHKKAATGHAQKHHKAAKHHAVAKKHKGTVVKRGLAPAADQVASCAAEDLAASLRLSGLSVAPVDVLELYWHTASDPDAGASILATLEAASEFGLGGVRPASFSLAPCPDGGTVYQCVRCHGECCLRDPQGDAASLADMRGRDEQLDRRGVEDVSQREQFVYAEALASPVLEVYHDVGVPRDADLGHLFGELPGGPVLDLSVDPDGFHDPGGQWCG